MAEGAYAAAAIIAAALGAKQQSVSRNQAKKLGKAQARIQEVEAARAKRKNIREARIARAQIENRSAAAGVSDSTGAIQGGDTVFNQATSANAGINVSTGNARTVTGLSQKVSDAQGRAGVASAVGGVANRFAGDAGYEQLARTIFE